MRREASTPLFLSLAGEKNVAECQLSAVSLFPTHVEKTTYDAEACLFTLGGTQLPRTAWMSMGVYPGLTVVKPRQNLRN